MNAAAQPLGPAWQARFFGLKSFELRWAEAALEAFAPPRSQGFSPRKGQVEYLSVFKRMLRAANPRAALGIRLGVWIVALSPLWLGMSHKSIRSLPVQQRAVILRRLLRHRSFIVRELTLILKVVASMAIFGVPALRRDSGYDRRAESPNADTTQKRRRLRVVANGDVEGLPQEESEQVA